MTTEALDAKLKTLPRSSGVYFHKSRSGEIIYVGKAAVLKNRVRQYFQTSRLRDVKTDALVAEIYDTDWVETESEIDALFLESEMVKRYMPRYNVLLRDDKSQMFVRITMRDEWPVVSFTRNPADDGAEYYGPFYNGYELKKALRYLRRVFPYFVREPKATDSKLEMQIGLNPNTHLGSDAYKASLRKLISYIKGNRKAIANEIESDMKQAARNQEFERAAQLRNKLRAMRELQQRVCFGDREFLDISKDSALVQLSQLLGLDRPPKRIEGYDISHMSGRDVVASMVVFTNGASDRAEYRKFKMTKQTNDDVGNMHETLTRRLSEKNLKSWGAPDLLLIDGGKGQLGAAVKVVQAHGLAIPVISIAKRNEEVLLHKTLSNIQTDFLMNLMAHPIAGVSVRDEKDYMSVDLHVGQQNAGSHSRNLRGGNTYSPYTDLTKLFQRIRDESHRFAVSYHTNLKRTSATKSVLDDIPGVGPATRKKLIKTFGSVRGIREASEADIAAAIGVAKARQLHTVLNGTIQTDES